MTTKHFTLTADASATVTAGKHVSRAFMQIARAIRAANAQAAGLTKIPPHLDLIAFRANVARKSIERLSDSTWVSAMKMRYALRDLDGMFPKFDNRLPRGGDGSDGSGPAHRPLFGSAGAGLQQGQAVQNAIMAMLPALVPAIIFASAKYFSIQEDVSAVKMANALKRAGIGGETGSFRNQANRLSDFTGNSQQSIEDLMGGLALSGIKDPVQNAAFANLALSIEAAGGSASNFAKALKGEPEEVAEKLNAMAEELGINVSEYANVNQILTQFQESLGGLSHEVNKAKEGWPELWNTIKENLGILGREGTTGKIVEGTTALLGGEPGKAGFMASNMVNDLSNSIPSSLSNVSRGIGLFKAANFLFNKPVQAISGANADRKIDKRLDSQLASGKITQAQYDQQVAQYYDSVKKGDYGAIYDQAYNPNDPSRVGPKAPVQLEGPKGQGKVDKKNRIMGPEEYPNTRVSFEVRGNPFGPSMFSGNGSMKLK